MRNLKKMLSLVMALAMVASFMVVGASAAEFSDAKNIRNVDAVNTLVALGVIKGYDTGDFKPEGTVTRAEMAKMICVALNGGRDPQLGAATTVYTDVPSTHWAAGYIAFCTNLKLVAGQGNNTFAPDATVTGSQAAKMLLVALGYDVEFSGLTGVNWEINTNVAASKNDLYANLSDLNPSLALTRDNAAQMIYNALDAEMVELSNGAYKTSQYSYTGTEQVQTGTERVYKMTVVAGKALDAYADDLNNTYYASYADADAAADTYAPATLNTDYKLAQETRPVYGTNKVTKNVDETMGHLYLSLLTNESGVLVNVEKDSKGTYTVTTTAGTYDKVKGDFSALMGQKVKVLYKAADNVYGVYASTESAVIATGVIGDISVSGTTLKIDGTVYKTDEVPASTPVYAFNDFATTTMLTALPGNKAASVTAIDNDDDGKIDLLIYKPFTAQKVTYVGKTSVTLSISGANDLEDINYYEGIAKNDWVKVSAKTNTVDDTLTVEKMDAISGTVEANRSGEAKIDGVWYSLGSGVNALDLGSVYDVAVVGGYIYNAEKTSGSATMSEVILVTDPQTAKFGLIEARAYFTDGTSKIINVSKIGNTEVTTGTTLTGEKLYTYKMKDGNYELKLVDGTNKAGADSYDSANSGYVEATKKLGGSFFNDETVIFVAKASQAGYKTFTGADAKNWKNFGASYVALSSTINGLKTVKVAFIISADANLPSASGTGTYGYVTSKPQSVKVGDDYYDSYTIWTESGSIDVLDKDNDLVVKKGDVIKYDDLGNNKIENSNVSTDIAAITGLSNKNMNVVKPNGTVSTVVKYDKDTVILYVDSTKPAGVEGGELDVARMQANGSYILNAWVVPNGNDNTLADLIVYDVNGDIDNLDNAKSEGIAGLSVADGTGTNANGITVKVTTDRDYAIAGDTITYTVEYSGTASAATTITFTAGTSSTDSSNSATVAIANGAVIPAGTTVTFTATVDSGASSVAAAKAVAANT
ncbi:MAG: S-layer homology domain-containing protein [Clostridia bacterium]|nr:S-layer homology domain-containing protein [Clostridia bacterium]